MTYDKIIREVSDRLNLPANLVDKTYRAYWRAVREYIIALPLKKDLSDEEFMELRPNVNIPSIGKLYVTLGRYQSLRRMHEKYLETINNKQE